MIGASGVQLAHHPQIRSLCRPASLCGSGPVCRQGCCAEGASAWQIFFEAAFTKKQLARASALQRACAVADLHSALRADV